MCKFGSCCGIMLTVIQPHNEQNGVVDDVDHLFLLPERALMDSSRLQKDLEGLDFDPRLMHAAPMGNVWLSGAVDTNVKHNRPFSAQKSGTLHWFACIGPQDDSYTARSESTEERDNRLKMLRDKQNEERQRKLEELKAQALAAQRFREIKEEERRKRIEELRLRDNDRRQQVGERKRLINEAERDRRESILKKNMEREARFELKKRNERSSAAFAFGSSTPRMLEPADTGGSFWGHRRATSTNNIMFTAMPLTRRSSERELDGSKKRATSAGGLDRNNADGETIPAGCASGHVGRRRTDLMPTIPTRDLTSTPGRKPFTKSPGPSRPDSSLSHQSTSSISSTVNMRSRPIAAPRKPRPASIAVTGVTYDKNPLHERKNETKPPLPRSRKTSLGKAAPERTSKLTKSSPKVTPKASPLQSPCTDAPSLAPVPAPVPAPPTENTEAKLVTNNENAENPTLVEINIAPTIEKNSVKEHPQKEDKAEIQVEQPAPSKTLSKIEEVKIIPKTEEPEIQLQQQQSNNDELSVENTDMTASMIAKNRINTEEEAKAALAERRRLAREEAERQAEAERLRIEAEIKAEQERQRQEEEQARLLAEQQRHAEEERLAQAIKEAQKREEEERLRREEEMKQKLEKEEQEKKAREESEKQRIEMQERLKQEEKEREARRKRVEAIMLRTRASKGAGNNQSKDEGTDKVPNNDDVNNQVNNKPAIVSYEESVNEKEAELFNGSFNKSQASVISKENSENGEPQHSNGHRNGVNTEEFSKVNKSLIEHNVTNTLLDFGELDQFKNANTNLDIPADKITNEDSVNSNNPTESNSTTDFLL